MRADRDPPAPADRLSAFVGAAAMRFEQWPARQVITGDRPFEAVV
jgi:hypothetical protein